MQSALIFLGECFCLPYFFLFSEYNSKAFQSSKDRQAQDAGLKPTNYLILLIPFSLDFLVTAIMFIALNFLSASIFEIFRGGVIVFTVLFQNLILKRVLNSRQITGAALVVLGIGIVGIGEVLYEKEKESDGK